MPSAQSRLALVAAVAAALVMLSAAATIPTQQACTNSYGGQADALADGVFKACAGSSPGNIKSGCCEYINSVVGPSAGSGLAYCLCDSAVANTVPSLVISSTKAQQANPRPTSAGVQAILSACAGSVKLPYMGQNCS